MAGKAESRLIYNSVSMSERVASLDVKGALLYTWLITHCDTQGRMQGKARVVKQLVVPFLEEITVDDVEEALTLMEEEKLILRYEDSRKKLLLQVLDWWLYQKGLKYWAPSQFEHPKGWEDRVTPRDDKGKFTKI